MQSIKWQTQQSPCRFLLSKTVYLTTSCGIRALALPSLLSSDFHTLWSIFCRWKTYDPSANLLDQGFLQFLGCNTLPHISNFTLNHSPVASHSCSSTGETDLCSSHLTSRCMCTRLSRICMSNRHALAKKKVRAGDTTRLDIRDTRPFAFPRPQ